jgi:hypothetical protein
MVPSDNGPLRTENRRSRVRPNGRFGRAKPDRDTQPGARAGPESASAEAAAAAPAPLASSADAATDDGPFTLETTLLGHLALPAGAASGPELDELSRRAALYATRARGDGTRRAYRSAWARYVTWCTTLAREPLAADPDTIAMYVVRLAAASGCAATWRPCRSG